jgi:hypothetical protein
MQNKAADAKGPDPDKQQMSLPTWGGGTEEDVEAVAMKLERDGIQIDLSGGVAE